MREQHTTTSSGASASGRAPRGLYALLWSTISVAGTALFTSVALSVVPTVRAEHGEAALFAWVLLAVASAGAVLCAYLVLIWSLATVALWIGPASHAGGTLVAVLRLLAPQLARRVVMGAAVASTATGLVLVPATAATPESSPESPVATVSHSLGAIDTGETSPAQAGHPEREDLAGRPTATASSLGAGTAGTTVPGHVRADAGPVDASPAAAVTGPVAAETAHIAPSDAPGDPSAETQDGNQDELPALGWGEPSPGTSEPSTAAPDAPERDPAPVTTIVVRSGDSLWSITDSLLGPGADPPEDIAEVWPRLHAANRDLIGPDPDRLIPGQQLIIPATLIQEQS